METFARKGEISSMRDVYTRNSIQKINEITSRLSKMESGTQRLMANISTKKYEQLSSKMINIQCKNYWQQN